MTHVMRALFVMMCVICAAAGVSAQDEGVVSGRVVDVLGARIAGAAVTLSRDGSHVAEAKSDKEGAFTFPALVAGRYQVTATAPGFQPRTTDPVYAGPGVRPSVELVLELGPLQQDVVVTAEVGQVLQSQTGAPVTVIDSTTLEALNKPDLFEALRLVPGAHIVQVGQRGGTTSLFLRGGNSNFTKVLMDGMPANDIGGGFDFSQIDTAGVDSIEVMRQTNSVVYGSDALTGVVNITTRRGSSRVPMFEYGIDGGNLRTFRNSISLGGAVRRYDYFSQYSFFTTDNHTPNSGYHRGTYAGRFGMVVAGGTKVSGTLRWIDGRFGSANAFSLFQVADDSTSESDLLYGTITADSQFTDRWQSTIWFGSAGQTMRIVNPAPSGTPFDPYGFGANYLGNTVTLTAANGQTVTGRGVLDFGFAPFPQTFAARSTRRLISGQTTYRLRPDLSISGGGRYEHEAGYDDPKDDPTATRNNGGGFVEARAAIMNRAYLSGGIGVEHNRVFGTDVVPRFSAAVYLRPPSADALGDTKISFNIGKGIKAPSVSQQLNSLFELLQGTPAGATVSPLGPERSRGWDAALEQGFSGDTYRARVGFYENEFEDLLEFLNRAAMGRAGVPFEAADAASFAYVNSQSFRAHGVELSADAAVNRQIRLGGSYTYLDAEVTQALTASRASNPAFVGFAIGAFSPLEGERPFRRPVNSGTLFISYNDGPAAVALSAYFAGKRDDSTFLSDEFLGNSLLLPNQDLDPAYQKVDLSASYLVHRQVNVYTSIENLFDKEYEAAFGFPSLPFTIRAGVTVTFGGDR
jgi:iron complex outermembrane receptor protein/vitamin B12 transporter